MLPLTQVTSIPTAAAPPLSGEVQQVLSAPDSVSPVITSPAASELAALQARCEYLNHELNRRGQAIHQQAVRLMEHKTQMLTLEKRLTKQESEIKQLQKTVASAKEWQKRSWVKRAFHKWRASGSEKS